MSKVSISYCGKLDTLEIAPCQPPDFMTKRIGTDQFVYTRDGYPIRSSLILDGDFELLVPVDETIKLESWTLSFRGLSLIYSNLNRKTINNIYGLSILSCVDYLYSYSTSISDRKANNQNREITTELYPDLQALSEERSKLLNIVDTSSDGLILPRHIFINDDY